MARTNATNFTGPLQFPYATAGTDIFRKEDVQTLALAVDGHDHSTGKGLILPLSAIPVLDASKIPPITSAMITDGTIQTADLAANSATALLGEYNALPSFSTTTVGSWLATPIAVNSVITTGARLIMVAIVNLHHSAAGANFFTGLAIDGGPAGIGSHTVSTANGALCVTWTYIAGLSAGTHSFVFYVLNNTAGTLSMDASIGAHLTVTEERR
jgi:hypothetical protein